MSTNSEPPVLEELQDLNAPKKVDNFGHPAHAITALIAVCAIAATIGIEFGGAVQNVLLLVGILYLHLIYLKIY